MRFQLGARLEKMEAEYNAEAAAADEPHVAMIPLQAQGHVNPMMRLACRLAALGIRITYVVSERFLKAALAARDEAFEHSIRVVSIPKGTIDEQKWKGNASTVIAMLAASDELVEPFEAVVRDLQKGSSVRCVISDTFLDRTQDVANRLGIPRVVLWTSNAAAGVVNLLLDKLIENDYVPVQEKLARRGNVHVDGMPGMRNLHLHDIPFSFYFPDPAGFQKRVEKFRRLTEAACVLGSTFQELEPEAVAGVRTLLSKFWPIGPLLPKGFLEEELKDATKSSAALGANTTGLWEEDQHCLHWLEQQKPASVIYMSFGSLANFSPVQFEEFAMGLEASDVGFLWVVRPNLVEGLSKDFYEGFVERTKDRGLIISWAPQLQVLRHRSVAAFLTHCGWNSVMEGICSGVPLLGWPCFAEQNLNCHDIVEEWKIGLGFDQKAVTPDGIVQRGEVEKVLRAAMKDETIKKNAMEMKEAARKAAKEGGSSDANIKRLAHAIKNNSL